MRRSPPGAPTETVLGALATEPCPIATELVAVACTRALAPKAEPLLASTVALWPTATAFAVVALAELPTAVADDTLATPPVATAKSPNAAPPLAADAPLPTAIEPVASALVPMAMALAPVDAALVPIAIAPDCVACEVPLTARPLENFAESA